MTNPLEGWMRRELWYRTSRIALTALAIVAFILLIVLSPVLLGGIVPGSEESLSRLSNVGQAYGSISALLSSVALLGVAYSTVIQVRQTKVNQIQLFRGLHSQLLTRMMDDPETYAAAVSDLDPADTKGVQQRLFFVLYMNYFWSIYEIGEMREEAVRFDLFEPMFRSRIARDLWVVVRPFWQVDRGDTRKGRRFLVIVENEHAKAVARTAEADAAESETANDGHE